MSAGKLIRISAKPRHKSERGLPKPEVRHANVTKAGLEGDFNKHRTERLRGAADQALLVMPAEMIATLNEEFWPVKPGDLGENLTTEGIPYDSFAPGKRYRVGDSLTIEISKPADPCKNLYVLSYVDSMFGPEFIKTLVGRRGWYAGVISPGAIKTGDRIAPITSDK